MSITDNERNVRRWTRVIEEVVLSSTSFISSHKLLILNIMRACNVSFYWKIPMLKWNSLTKYELIQIFQPWFSQWREPTYKKRKPVLVRRVKSRRECCVPVLTVLPIPQLKKDSIMSSRTYLPSTKHIQLLDNPLDNHLFFISQDSKAKTHNRILISWLQPQLPKTR